MAHYKEANAPQIDVWLRFAEARHVENLCLQLITRLPFLYTLPPYLLCLSCLERLTVRSCCFSLDRNISWPRLKLLRIEYSKLTDDDLEEVFRGSPILEFIVLRRCWGIDKIIISSTIMKKLELADLELCNVQKIWAPHLQSLQISGRQNVFIIDNVSSLEEASLAFGIPFGGPGFKGICCDLLKHILEKLHSVRTMTIGSWCLQVLSLLEMEGVSSLLLECRSLLLECRNLTLDAAVSQWDLPGMVYMLRSSECLEKLVIRLSPLYYFGVCSFAVIFSVGFLCRLLLSTNV